METISDTKTLAALTGRISLLQAGDQPRWGKMNTYQMLKHCTLSEEMFQGKKRYERLFIGRLFGKIALKWILKPDNRMKRNQPTHLEMRITGTGNFEEERAGWIELLNGYAVFQIIISVTPFLVKCQRSKLAIMLLNIPTTI